MGEAVSGWRVEQGGASEEGYYDMIHLCFGGPERWISCAGKVFLFEDHHYCGPVVLNKSTRDPSENQPSEKSIFWQHVQAWYEQGKQTKEIDGKVWCVYEAQMQGARRIGKSSRTA